MFHTKMICRMLTFTALAVFTASSRAALLAEYQFEGGSAVVSATSDDNDAPTITGLTVSAITTSQADLFFEDNNSLLVSDGSADDGTWFSRASILDTDPVTDSHYLEFTLTPTVDTLTLDELAVHIGASRGPITGVVNWALIVRTSLDGFAADLGTIVSPTGDGYNSPPSWDTVTLDLSSLGAITGPITFRLYARDDSGSSSDQKYMLLDTVSVIGSLNAVVIPTPAALPAGLLLLGAAAMCHRRGA